MPTYNTAKHGSTKFSPFEVMFFCKGVLPVDFMSMLETARVNYISPTVKQLIYFLSALKTEGLYGLQIVDDPSRIVSRVNGVHLKPYHYPVHSDLTLSSHDLNHSPSSQNHSPSSCRQLNQCHTGSQLDLSLTPSLLHPSPSVIVHGVTSSTPILQGGFFAEFNVLATPPLLPQRLHPLLPQRPHSLLP